MITVMLVDDQNLVRKGVRSLLELSEEIKVLAEAADGAEAIRMIPEVNPDVVLLDMRMPNMSGLDVLQHLSAENRLPPARCVLPRLTGGQEVGSSNLPAPTIFIKGLTGNG